MDERLTRLAAHILANFSSDMRGLLRDMAHIRDPRHHAQVQAAFQAELFEPLQAALTAALADQRLRPAELERRAWAFLGLVNTFTGRDMPTGPEALARELTTLYLHGVRTTPTGGA